MTRWFIASQVIATCVLLLLSSPAPGANPEPKLERVVMLMRHGVRSPETSPPIPSNFSSMRWPRWSVAPGALTERGANGIALVAAADRRYFIDAGLLPPAGCPPTGQVTVRASKVLRAIETASVWSRSTLLDCEVTIQHPASGAPDPLFHVLDDQPAWFDGRRAYEEALAQSPLGGLAAQEKQLASKIRRLETILGCIAPACDLEKVPTTLVQRKHDRPEFKGLLNIGSTASESLLLEYLEGMPMSDVGWGRASRADIADLLVLNTTKYKYVDWPPYIAKAAAGPLARMIVEALSAPGGSPITLLAGHDTNVAQLGGLLGLRWQAASYPADNVPPGSALGFEVLSDEYGRKFVRAFFRSQTMDQLRKLEPLSSAHAPYRAYLEIPGCGSPENELSCPLRTFAQLVEARLQ